MVFERDEVPEKNAKVTIDISTSFKKKIKFYRSFRSRQLEWKSYKYKIAVPI